MKTILLLTVLTLLLVAAASAADTLVLVTTPPTNNFFTADWSQLGKPGTIVNSPFTMNAGPVTITGSFYDNAAVITQEGNGFVGDFLKNDYLFQVHIPLTLQLSNGASLVGSQIESSYVNKPEGIIIAAFDKNHVLIGGFGVTLPNHGLEDGSAPYFGIQDQTGPNIYYIEYTAAYRASITLDALTVIAPSCGLGDTTGAVYRYGDIFEGRSTGGGCPGCVSEFSPNGTLIKNFPDGSGTTSETTGTAFDVAGNLYVTNWDFGTVSKLDKTGKVANPALMTPANDGQSHPESIRAVGSKADLSDLKLYVGGPACACVLVYDSAGTLLKTINVAGAGSTKGTDWIEFLRPNILIYTGEGTEIKAYDIVANTQLPDLITGLPGYRDYQLRVHPTPTTECGTRTCSLPGIYILVADADRALMIDPTPWLNASPIGTVPATVKTTYTLPGVSLNFSMAIDPDAMHFWAGDIDGKIWQVNTCSGQIGYSWLADYDNTLTVWGGLGKVW